MSERVPLAGLLAIEHELSGDERAARDAVRAFVVQRFLPRITQAHRDGSFPRDLIPEIAELGVFGANIQGYGCAGMNNVAYGLVMQELERGDSGLRSLCSVQGALVMYPILAYGSEAQRQKWLPELARGKLIGCFGLTEPNSGSDPGSMRTTAEKDGASYVLDGIKAWITNSPIADLAVVWAKVKDEGDRIRGFVVERGSKGFETPSIEGKFTLRASPTGEIHLTGCRVPAANLLPESGGLKSPLGCLTQARYGIGWGVVGAAIDCYETVLNYGVDRVQFGKPIASFQLYQAQLAQMATDIITAQLLALHFGRLKDAGKLSAIQVSLLKRNNVTVARNIAHSARAMLGGIGITDAYPVIRHLMNLESVYTYEGTHEIHTLALGRALTGIDAFQ
ncbi:MAG: acyl-CoA dehydrogenase family protein [Deltaproteobacteria bacterium]|nr:acyl-CoA dehydrogenase family protein [Deltaproteobacteria bacterium]